MGVPKRGRFSAVDLFCGCGGLSLGLRRAGFRIVAAIDSDSLAASTYQLNHRRTHLVNQDVRLVDPGVLMQAVGLNPGDLDLMAGCPPCQGFSTLRTLNGNRNIDEPMNDLVYEFVRFVRVFMPRALMMENVPALLKDSRLQDIVSELETLGYECAADLFNAERYGVSQRRRRMILFGSRGDCPPFPRPVRARRTVAQAIRRLHTPERSDDPLHNYTVRRAEHVEELMRGIPKDGGSRTDLPESDQLQCHRGFDGFKDVYGRMAWGQPAPTITGGCINPSKEGSFILNKIVLSRYVKLRCYRGFLQRTPSICPNGRYPVAAMIGNAFPPKFGRTPCASALPAPGRSELASVQRRSRAKASGRPPVAGATP